ncbi:MAG: c-type cytochrome, partial [Planctomycetales bacterium]|nr:c-type cytochrome [Planctomycetales bacterium]
DRDLDGAFETRKVFAEGLNLVSGLEVGFGGVWVGAAPYLMFIPDRDGDDKPDGEPQILLDGFGYQDTHETLNAFIWGPDGWLYGCHGVFTHSRVGKPGTPDAERTPMNAAVWRYHPTRHEFDVFSWGTSNPWGVDFNDHGHAFITACVIPHLWHIIQGARYERQGGQHFDRYFYEDIGTIAEHRHYAGDIRDHAWWGAEPQAPPDTLAAGGGHAHCGAMIYLADNWPSAYRDQIFMNNVHGNRINNDRLVRRGSGYVGKRAPDVMLANDKWFRGINLKYGPDGSVYEIDWYDPNACHRTNPEIWDRTNGRVYNLAYGDPQRAHVDLSQKSDAELVELHLHSNEWYVRMARRLLQERADTGKLDIDAASGALWKIATTHIEVPRRLRAIWTLHAIGALNAQRCGKLLASTDENIRSWAIQLELEDGQIDDRNYGRLVELAERDSSQLVRLYLCSALQRLPLAQRWAIVERLSQHAEDADDHNLPLMLWYGAEPIVPTDVDRALKLAEQSRIPKLREFVIRRAAADDAGLDRLVNWLNRHQDVETQSLVLKQMLRSFEGRVGMKMPPAWLETYDVLVKGDNAKVREQADEVAILFGDQRIYPRMRAQLTDESLPIERRQQALQILVRGQDKQAAGAFQAALASPQLRGAAIRALGTLDDVQTPARLLAQYAKLTEQEKRDAIGTLTSRPAYVHALLDALEKNTVPTADLHAYNIRQIVSLNDAGLKERLQQVWGEIRESSADKQQQMVKFSQMCAPAQMKNANPRNGRRIFSTTCANCHRLFGEGGEVGPDITGSNRANLDYVLQNVVDPSAVLGKDYRMTILELADGRVVSGLIKQETDSAITIRTLNDTLLIAKEDVDDRTLSELSMMPEGLLDQLKPTEVRDLVAYLASPSQVPVGGPAPNIDMKSGRVEGALEAESLKIVEKSAGSVSTQGMGSFKLDRWSDGRQLWWTGAKEESTLAVELPVEREGSYRVAVVLTRAPDYAIVQLSLDDQPLGEPLDLYAPQVVTTGVLDFPPQTLTAGPHRLKIEILGANPHAQPSRMVGIDFVQLTSADSQ